MAKWNEYGLKSGTSAEDEVLILDSDTNTNKRTTVGDIQEFANGKMLEKENSALNTEAKDLIGAINEVDAKNDAQDTKIEEVENKFSDYLKKTDVDSTLLVSGSPADAKVVGEQFKKSKEAITDLADKKITKFYASNQGNTNLPDSDKGKIQDMFLYGKSEQVQYKGRNLIRGREVNSTLNGITCKYNGDGTYTVNGTATADAPFIIYGNFANLYGSASSLKLVGCPSGGSVQKYFLRGYRKNGNPVNSDEYGSGISISSFEESGSNIAIIVRSGVTVNNLVFKPMLTADTTSTYADFEPYIGGIPSPNPDYPQEIKAVVNPKVVVRGKNLLDYEKWKKTGVVRGSAVYENNGVTLTSSGADAYTVANLPVHVEPNKKYKLSWEEKDNSQGAIYVFDRNGKIIASVSNVNTKKLVFENPSDNNIIYFRFGVANVSSTISYENIQIEQGEIVTPYEPYTEQSTQLPYTLYAIPVTTGGNITIGGKQYVADYVDVESGKLVRNIKHKVLVGIENYNTNTGWKTGTWTVSNWIADGKTAQDHVSVTDIISPSAIKNAASKIANGVIGIGATKNDLFLNFGTEYTTATKIKEYITQNNVDVYYILATPEEIDLTPDQIQAFKSLSTNYPVTNIEVSSDQLDGYTVFNYPISMEEGWNYVKQQIGDTRDYIYDMDLQSAEAYVNSEYAVALAELEVM